MNVNNFSDLLLAPIAGYSDAGFRSLCYRYGAKMCFTEMVSAKGLYHNNSNTADLLTLSPDEKGTAVQLFGSEPDIIAAAVLDERLAKFSTIDINMGCPVPKIVNNGEGSALMRDPDLIYAIVKSAASADENKIITVKMRAGFCRGDRNAVECALAAESAGARMVTVHGRTRDEFYSGKADYEIIARVKDALHIPVCANGDVTDGESYCRIKEFTGADYVMIARGALGRPYIFAEITGRDYEFDLKSAIREHIAYLSFLPDRVVANCMKKHIAFYVKGMRGQKAIKEKVFSAQNLEEILQVIDVIN